MYIAYMPAKKNWVGLTYGRLTVIEEVPPRKALVRCECGREKVVHRCSLSHGLTTSCGCWQKEVVRALVSKTPEQVLFDRLDVRGMDECWPWIGGCDERGYGMARVRGGQVRAHRAMWEHFFGSPGGYNVLHQCDNPSCCNPAHLFAGTQQDNVDDMIAKGRGFWQKESQP